MTGTAAISVDNENTTSAAYQNLLRSEARLRLQFDRMPLACIIWDKDFRVESWNPAAEAIFGFARTDAVGRHAYELIVPRDAQPHVTAVLSRLTQGDLAAHSINENVTRDGKRILCSWTNTPLVEEGRVTGVLSMVEDITEKKRAEDTLKQQAALLHLAHDAIIVRDMQARVSFWNRGAVVTYGWTAEEAHGRVTHDLLRTRCAEGVEPVEQKVVTCGAWEGELVHTTRAGDEITVASRWSLQRDVSGTPIGFLEINRDITERKRAEREVRCLNEELERRVAARTTQLEAVNKELEAFNYAVAHDLRAPLRHIHGFAEILAEEAKPVLDELAQKHLRLIRESVQHMGQLLEDLLTLSHLGRQELSTQLCGLRSVIDEVVDALKSETAGREIEWRITDLPFVECDPGLMKQVVTNLLSNAVKFTRPRRPAVIEIGENVVNGEHVLFVRDNGVGFSMNYVDKLFGLFQRLHRQQDFEGTGVGLAIVQRIIHKHGGRVWAEGELNKGATFYFTVGGPDAQPRSPVPR